MNIAVRRRHQRLAIPEKGELLNCDRPCAEEEWRATPLHIRWGALGILKFLIVGGGSQIRRRYHKGSTSEREATAARSAVAHVQSGYGCGKRGGKRKKRMPHRKVDQRKRRIQRM